MTGRGKKRKGKTKDGDWSGKGEPSAKRNRRNTCFLHSATLVKVGDFVSLKECYDGAKTALENLHEIRDRRLKEDPNSSHRMKHVCDLIPNSLDGLDLEINGWHRKCYQAFTKNQDRLKTPADVLKSPERRNRSPRKSATPTSTSSTATFLFPKNECLFCNKDRIKVKIGGVWIEQRPNQDFVSWKHKDSGWKKILTMAEEMQHNEWSSLWRKVNGVDLPAAEAHFHKSCYDNFYLSYTNFQKRIEKRSQQSDTDFSRKCAVHEHAYSSVVAILKERVIANREIIPLTELHSEFLKVLTVGGIEDSGYRSDKMRARLERDEQVCNAILFSYVKLSGCIGIYLISSAHITVNEAIVSSYLAGTRDTLKDAAITLRTVIKKAYDHSTGLKWPPTADELGNVTQDQLPEELLKFLNLVFSGKEPSEKCEKTRRLVYSIGQDVCRAVTNGEWKLPKHILICLTIRHLYRSKVLTQILNRLGHSESYSYGLEVETALAEALDKASTHLTPHIVIGESNSVFHSEWDNLNKITTNLTGSNVVNSSAGIMLQEVTPGTLPQDARTLPEHERDTKKKRRSYEVDVPETLPAVTIYNRVGPSFPANASFVPPPENVCEYNKYVLKYYVWLLARWLSSNDKQEVPCIGGFISATGIAPERKTTIDYYNTIHQPITKYETVQELLQRSEEATKAVGQKYTISTFDLGVCMKALPLIWRFPDKFKEHVVIPGPFHTEMNFIGMLTNHKMRGSGYAEIIEEASLITKGCVSSVLSGKAFSKALFNLKAVNEALERLLLEVFIEDENIEIMPECLIGLIKSCDRNHLDSALNDESTSEIIQKYQDYQARVRNGHLGKTGMFWLSFMDQFKLILMLIYAVKTHNRKLLHHCNGEMAVLFFAYDGQNYSRYLTWFETFVTNLELTHPGATELIDKGALGCARSLIPDSLCAIDKTMEETFMKFAKGSGGVLGIFEQYGAYQRWCRTTSERARYYEEALEMCGLLNDSDSPKEGKHRELHKSQIKRSEAAVLKVISAIQSFTNPWRIPNKDRLYSLASGSPISTEVENDVLNAETLGRKLKNEFTNRFKNGSKLKNFDPVKRQKLRTMEAASKKAKLTTSQGKLVQFQEQSDLAFTLLVKSQLQENRIDLRELLEYSLALVPPCFGTMDGYFAKTNKATALHFLMEDNIEEVNYPNNSMFIQDGNALFHSLIGLAPTFGGFSLQILGQMAQKQNFIFSTDSYDEDSIKAQERARRGSGEKLLVDGPAIKIPKDFKVFLSNDENKVQLCNMLKKVWGSTKALSHVSKCSTAILIVEGKAYEFKCSNMQVEVEEIFSLASNQEESDTRFVLYVNYAKMLGFKDVVIRSPDTDVFFILLFHACDIAVGIFLDTGTGKNRQLINVSEKAKHFGADWCKVLLGIYVFTGEDCTSAFKGKGKVAPLKKLMKYPKFHKAFVALGEEWNVPEEVSQYLEEFVCVMYGYVREKSVNTVRFKMLKKMIGENDTLTAKSKVDLCRLPPCHDSLVTHIQRVNYRLACYKRAALPIFERPKPSEKDQGWGMSDEGFLEPIWSQGPAFPTSLVDILYSTNDDNLEEEEEEIIEMDVDSNESSDDDD